MMSQIGSCARGTPSALDKARSAATGTVRSAILTYFGQIVIQEAAATKRSYPRRRSEPIAPAARARSHGRSKTYRVSPRDAKVLGRNHMADKPYDRLEGVIWYDGKLVPWG